MNNHDAGLPAVAVGRLQGSSIALCGVAFPWPMSQKYFWGNSCQVLSLPDLKFHVSFFSPQELFQESKRKFVEAPPFDLDQSTAAQGVLPFGTTVKIRAEVQDDSKKHRRDRRRKM